MGVWRVLLHVFLAAVLAGCAASIPVGPAQENSAATLEAPDQPAAAEEPAQVAEQPEPPPQPLPKPITASKASQKKTAKNASTPTVGSPEWKKERAEDARKEEHIKQVIESICSGC